jgi:scyllo-inositol 2-dehydrogenase (NADP+)
MSASEPVRVAIAGLGRAGWDIHAKAIKPREGFKIVAAIDREAERLKEAESTFPGCRGYSEWPDFLKNTNGAELVVIATQSNLHAPLAIDAFGAGLHVMVEKPMALSVEEAECMAAAARKAGRLLTVHHNHRCDADVHHLLAIFNSGILGRVIEIKSTNGRYYRRNDWQALKKYGGGILNNYCSHSIDQLLLLLQSPAASVWGDLQHCISPGDAEDHSHVIVRAKNGRVADLEISWAGVLPLPPMVVLGTHGTLVRDGDDFLIKYVEPASLPKIQVVEQLAVPGRKYGTLGSDEKIEWKEKRVKAALPEYQVDFYGRLHDSIRKGSELFVTPESAIDVIRVLELARKGTGFEIQK